MGVFKQWYKHKIKCKLCGDTFEHIVQLKTCRKEYCEICESRAKTIAARKKK